MIVKITCSVPTTYQIQSLRAFGLDNYKSHGDGSHSCESVFKTIKAARKYLRNRAEELYSTKREIRENLVNDRLYYDAGCASIERVN